MSAPEPIACLIWGGYAWGNTGDELCLAAALETAGRDSAGPVAILSPFPEYTQRLFPDATVIPFVPPPPPPPKIRRWKQFRQHCAAFWSGQTMPQQPVAPEAEWVRCLRRSKRLYLAGGGYLTDLFSLDLAMPPIELALNWGLPVDTAPIGLGPFAARGRVDQVASALGRMRTVKVRDAVSLEFCRARNVPAELCPDAAFAWLEQNQHRFRGAGGGRGSRKIGVCIFPQHGQAAGCDRSAWWVEFLTGLKAQFPACAIEGFCFHASLQGEFQTMVRLFSQAGLSAEQVGVPTMDFRQATVALQNYDLIISTRFHAVVAANVFQIPNVAIADGDYYQAKMQAAVKDHESFSRLVVPASVTPAELLEYCRRQLARPRPVAA